MCHFGAVTVLCEQSSLDLVEIMIRVAAGETLDPTAGRSLTHSHTHTHSLSVSLSLSLSRSLALSQTLSLALCDPRRRRRDPKSVPYGGEHSE